MAKEPIDTENLIALTIPKPPPWHKRVVTTVIQGIAYSVIILAAATILHYTTGGASSDAQEKKETEALVCILLVPPDERTKADTRFCLRETGLNLKDIPVPPGVEGYPTRKELQQKEGGTTQPTAAPQ